MKRYDPRKLLTGSLILLVSFNLFNVINFIFNLFTVRYLTLPDYGSLITLNYIILLFAVFSETIQTTITRYVAREKDKGKLKNIIKKSSKYALRYAIYFLGIYLLLAYPLSIYLKIDFYLVLLAGIMVFPVFFLPVVRALLQGRKMFFSLGMSVFVEGSVKLLVAVGLVLLGFRIYGAFLGILIGALISLLITFFMIKDYISVKERSANTIDIRSYSKPVFAVNSIIILFLTIDLFFAKLFFDPETAGIYAVSSTLAKIIFLATQPICRVMFPLSSELKDQKKSRKVLKGSLAILGAIIAVALIPIFLFSETIVYLYSGKVLVEAPSILIILSLYSSVLSLANLLLLYKLSIGALNNYKALIGVSLFGITLLVLFNDTILQFSYAVLASSIALLMGILLKKRR